MQKLIASVFLRWDHGANGCQCVPCQNRVAIVHETAVIEGNVSLDAPGIRIGPHTYLRGPVNIGADVHIHAGAIIGDEPEHRTSKGAGSVHIGARTVIREHVVIQRGTGDRETTIGEGCYIMHGAHVAHDCVLGDGVTLSPGVVLGGHTRVHHGATLGIGAATHQHTTIGAYAMVGMGAVVVRDVPPFVTVAGVPAKNMGDNAIGVQRFHEKPDSNGVFHDSAAWSADRRPGRRMVTT